MIAVTATVAASRWFERRTPEPPALIPYCIQCVGRKTVERFVAEVFLEHFGATVRCFMPTLLALPDRDGEIAGVLGCRSACDGGLFVEQYLDQPIEVALRAAAGTSVARSRIVEVGNLATRRAGVARKMFCELTRYLHERRVEWVVFSGTRDVRAVFRRLSLPFLSLCVADPLRLGPSRADWGSYYDQEPAVIAVSVNASHAILSEGVSASAVSAFAASPPLIVPAA